MNLNPDVGGEKKPYDGLIQLISVDKHKGFCSAFVVSKDYAITAAHCLVDSDAKMKQEDTMMFRTIETVDAEGNKTQLSAPFTIIGLNLNTDYALIKADFSQMNVFRLKADVRAIGAALQRDILPGVSVPLFAAGFPNGDKSPVVLAQGPCRTTDDFLECRGIMFHGMSGGPLIDPLSGDVIGINYAINDGSTYFRFMVGLFDMFNVEAY